MDKFTAVYEEDGDWWIASVEELPGANTQGRTLKEAYMKALGLGLTKGLGTFGFDLSDGINLEDAARRDAPSTFFSCRLANEYHLSLCELAGKRSTPGVFELDSQLASREIEPVWRL